MTLGPNYRRLWSASALSNLADGMFQITLPLLALRITRSPAAVAGVALCARLPWLLFALQAGALADRLDRRRTMVRVNVGRAILIGGLAAVTAAGYEELWILYVVAFALGIGETLFDTAAQSIMPMVVSRGDLSLANSRLYGVELTLNQFVGPPLGGLVAGVAIALSFSASAVAYVLAGAVLTLIAGTFRVQRTTPIPARLRTDIAEGLRFLWGHRLLRTLAMMVGGFSLWGTAMFSVFPVFAVEPGPLGLDEAGYGFLLTATAAGALAGSLLAPRFERRLGRARSLSLAMVTGVVAAVTPAVTTNIAAIFAAFAIEGAMIVVWNVITVSLRQRITPEHLLGRLNASYRLVAWGTAPLGAAVGGLVAELLSVRTVFVVSAVGMFTLLAGMLIVTDEAIAAAEDASEPEPAAT